jgi:rubrerythrin
MPSLTTKELILIQDNIKMTQNSISFMNSCAQIATDPQVKGLCQQMAKEHQNDVQVLMKHIRATTMQ